MNAIIPWCAFAISEVLPIINNLLKLSDCNLNSIGLLIYHGFRVGGTAAWAYYSQKRQKKEIVDEVIEAQKVAKNSPRSV